MLTGSALHDFGEGAVVVSAIGHPCFRCGSLLTEDPAWAWDGYRAGLLFLHISCALNLQMDINADLVRYRKATGIQPKST